MTPRQCWLAAMHGQPHDRVPLILPSCEFASRDEIDRLENPRHRALAERAFEHTVFGVPVPVQGNRHLMTPPGRFHEEREELPDGRIRITGTIDTPRGDLRYVNERDPVSQTGWHAEYPVKDRSDIEKIASVPWEPPGRARGPEVDDLPAGPADVVARTKADAFRRRGVLEVRVSSPFVCVAGMMKYEMFLELCATDLPLIEELTEMCRQRVLDCLGAALRTPGVDRVWMGGSEWLTPPMASPRLYDALVQEQERSIIDHVHGHSAAAVHIHCHGRVRDALPRMIQRGGDYTEPVEPPPDGDITMAEAKEQADGRVTLGGNIEARVLANESQAEVEAAVRAAFDGGRDRFLLRPTEKPSRLDEQEFCNYLRMLDVWDDLSPL
ncbi:MAG: uroporphyrinogen decarboxylase family protein [Planctomycetota bacterium]